jgi:alkanesulfonate monooxygenase SsuD/methylene tetrahydromethanopterin reductase-like flavin-dependent oxidoreductase (luciferase family)
MNVGIYFDLRNPPAWPSDPARLYGSTLELCEEADALGCHSIWLSEHHLFDDGYLPQPLTFAAAAARTKRARLGAGYRAPEFDLFDADIGRRYGATDECARTLRQLWGVVTPSPAQARPPIWMGYQGPKGAQRAGRLGEGLLSTSATLWPPYRDALIAAGHDPATSGRMAGGVNGWVTHDPERDWPMVSKHVAAQFDSYRRHMVGGTDRPVPPPVDPGKLRGRSEARGPLDRVVYGTPDQVAADIMQSTAGAPVETVFFWASIAGMPTETAARHVSTICTELAPRLAGYDPLKTAHG